MNKFCTTPNCLTWSKLPIQIQDEFKKQSKKILQFNKHRYPWEWKYNIGLSTIIKNITYPIPNLINSKIEALNGIRNIHLLTSKKYGKKIWILDDSHTNKYNCSDYDKKKTLNSELYIINQIKKSPCNIDLFLEQPYIPKSTKSRTDYADNHMSNLAKNIQIKECFDWDKRYCKIPNLRAHYIDVRTKKFMNEILTYLDILGLRVNYKRDIFTKNIKNISDHYNRIKEIFKDKNSYDEYLINLIKHSRLKKQLMWVKDPKIKKLIEKHKKIWIQGSDLNFYFDQLKWPKLKEKLNSLTLKDVQKKCDNPFDYPLTCIQNSKKYKVADIRKIASGCKVSLAKTSGKKKTRKELCNELPRNFNLDYNKQIGEVIYDLLARSTAVLMDVYTLTRLFRTFRQVKNKNSDECRNVIIWGGSYHGNRYRDFLKELGFHETSLIQTTNWHNCVQIKEFNKIFGTKNYNLFGV